LNLEARFHCICNATPCHLLAGIVGLVVWWLVVVRREASGFRFAAICGLAELAGRAGVTGLVGWWGFPSWPAGWAFWAGEAGCAC